MSPNKINQQSKNAYDNIPLVLPQTKHKYNIDTFFFFLQSSLEQQLSKTKAFYFFFFLLLCHNFTTTHSSVAWIPKTNYYNCRNMFRQRAKRAINSIIFWLKVLCSKLGPCFIASRHLLGSLTPLQSEHESNLHKQGLKTNVWKHGITSLCSQWENSLVINSQCLWCGHSRQDQSTIEYTHALHS